MPGMALAGASLVPGAGQNALPDFGNFTVEELANIKITSFTGKEQKLSQAAGAVYVITQEQIARSGLLSVPELLRLAPGLDVARVNGTQWSISARGTTGAYSNKLLVLIDGRSIYSPLFSGVFWDLGMPLPENIDRIEVIRGPGATIWGANAVLGVINIITKSSLNTQGTMVTGGGGSSERAFGSITHGGVAGSTSYRIYFGGSDNAPLRQKSGEDANDSRASVQAGFRLDGTRGKNIWMLEGEVFRAAENNTAINVSVPTQTIVESPAKFNASAASLTGEWSRELLKSGLLHVRSSYDLASRPLPNSFEAVAHTWDTQLQYDFTAKRRHHLSAGGGGRLISENVTPKRDLSFSTNALTYINTNAFAQDEMHFADGRLVVTAGAKLEHNHFGGWGVEPSANLLWRPQKRHSLWISAARSLRTPSLFEVAGEGPYYALPASADTGGLPLIINFVASPMFTSEAVTDFEAGYRGQLSTKVSVDLSAFYDRYSRLSSFRTGDPDYAEAPVPHLVVPDYTTNNAGAKGKGAEAVLAWQVLPAWKLEGSYTYNIIGLYLNPSAPPGSGLLGKEPSRNKWRLQSYVNLSKAWKLDAFLYGTSSASPTNNYGPDILVPQYTRLDVRLGYKAGRHWQLSLAGQNLLQGRHLEAVAELISTQSYVNRGFYLKSSWQY